MTIKPTLVTSEFCGPCKMLKEALKTKGILDSVDMADLALEHEFISSYNVKTLPSLITLSDKVIVGSEAILEYLEENASLDK